MDSSTGFEIQDVRHMDSSTGFGIQDAEHMDNSTVLPSSPNTFLKICDIARHCVSFMYAHF